MTAPRNYVMMEVMVYSSPYNNPEDLRLAVEVAIRRILDPYSMYESDVEVELVESSGPIAPETTPLVP